MDLRDYLAVVTRRWWLILLCVVLGGAGAALATARQTQVYGASVTFFLSDGSGRPVDTAVAERAQSRFSSYATLATSAPVVSEVLQAAGPGAPLLEVNGSAVANTIFFRLDVRSTSAAEGLRLAQSYASVFPTYITRFEGAGAGTDTTLQVLEQPTADLGRISPSPLRNVAVGVALGLLLGLGLAVLLESLDSRIRTSEELEDATRLSLLARIPFEHRKDMLVVRDHPQSRRAEALRQVRANLQFAALEQRLEILLVTSASEGEGKTAVAADLAVAFAEAGQRVVLVDADLRRPRLAAAFDLRDPRGLSDVLTGAVALQDCLQLTAVDGLRVLLSGSVTNAPSELLGSGRLAQTLEDIARDTDLVIIDSAPLLPVADTLTLLAQVDAVALVALVGRTRRPQIREAIERLRSFQAPVVGVVANGSRSTVGDYYGSYSESRSAPRPTTVPAPAALGTTRAHPQPKGPSQAPEEAVQDVIDTGPSASRP